MINNYVSINTILAKVTRDYGFLIDEGTLIEWISEGLGLLQVNDIGVEKRVAVMTVQDYQCSVPKGMKVISQILKNNYNDTLSIDNIIDVTQQTIVYNDVFERIDYNETDVSLVPQFNFNYSYFGSRKLNNNQFSIVRLVDNSLFDVTTSEISEDYAYSEDSYSLSVSNIIRFSFKEGQIVIIYYQQKLDENGYPLIPDNEYIHDALGKYVMYRNATVEYVRHIQGSESRFKEAEERWNRAKNIVRSLGIIPNTLDEYNHLIRNSIRMLPRSDRDTLFFR